MAQRKKKCKICGKSFLNLKNHFVQKHPEEDWDEYQRKNIKKKQKCLVCNKEFTNLKRHIVAKHMEWNKYVKQYFSKTALENMYECKICGEMLKQLNAQHIESHAVDYEYYLKEHEFQLWYEKQVIAFFNEYYIQVKSRFLLYSTWGGCSTITVLSPEEKKEGKKGRAYPLQDSDLKEHLRFEKTIGVHTPNGYSKLLLFDIDIKDLEIFKYVIKQLKLHGIKDNQILKASSGNKGYHVVVFFDKILPKTDLKAFYQIIRGKYPDKEIEQRGASEQGLKLPLGWNFNNPVSGFCGLLDEEGTMINNQQVLEFIKNIERVDSSVVYRTIKLYHQKSALTTVEEIPQNYLDEDEILAIDELYQNTNLLDIHATREEKIEKIKEKFEKGLSTKKIRHQSMFEIALYLKSQKNKTQEEIENILLEWIKKQPKWTYKSTIEEVKKEIEAMLKTMFQKDYKLIFRDTTVTITKMDLREVLSVRKKNLRELYFVIFIHGKAFGDKNGVFYMTYEQMNAMRGTNIRNSLMKKHIEELAKLGKIAILKKEQNKPTVYHLKALEKEMEVSVFHLCNKNCNNCLKKACAYLLSKEELDKYFDQNEVGQVVNLRGKCLNPNN